MLFLALAITLLAASAVGAAVDDDPTVVQTKFGLVQGTLNSLARAFYSIPFAKPPVEDLRWTMPVDPSPWSKTYDATECKPSCWQSCGEPFQNCTGHSEDCLFLTVYTPLELSPPEPYPVYVWIHGGSFIEGGGCGGGTNGSHLANTTEIIVVPIDYRLGALGFLWDETTGLVGNYGMIDQRKAIEWVYENIANFGGDPEKIYIGG